MNYLLIRFIIQRYRLNHSLSQVFFLNYCEVFQILIGEIAKKTNLPESTLRYYEKKGLLQVKRNKNGIREYEESDIEWIKFICRLKETGMCLSDIRHYSELRYQGDWTMAERLSILQEHRIYILEQQAKWNEYLQNIDAKIDFYKVSIKNKADLDS